MSRVARTDYSGDRIAKLEKKIESIQRDDIDKIDEVLEALGEKMDEVIIGIQDDIKGIKGDMLGMARMHNALKSRVEALENKK